MESWRASFWDYIRGESAGAGEREGGMDLDDRSQSGRCEEVVLRNELIDGVEDNRLEVRELREQRD